MTTATEGPSATVTFRLTGPMQSWGTTARTHGGGGQRPTQARPSKVGVLGLVANALGRDRADDIADLAQLRMGVRVDRAGTLEVDFHTAGSGSMPLTGGHLARQTDLGRLAERRHTGTPGPITTAALGVDYGAPRGVRLGKDGTLQAPSAGRHAVVSKDYFRADASFTVALTGPRALIHQIADALHSPARALYLGRKAYPLTGDLATAVTDDEHELEADKRLTAALTAAPLDERPDSRTPPAYVETAARAAGARVVHDQPGSRFHEGLLPRWENTTTITPPPLETGFDFFAEENA